MARPLTILFISFLLLPQLTECFSQEMKRMFGDVNEKDFNQIDKDTSNAIILFNIGSVNVDASRGTNYKRHIRYNVLKKSALQKWGSFKIIVRKNTFSKPRGATYNLEDGIIQKSELPESSVFEKKYDKYNDEISIAFPNVKEGSIVELQYTLKETDLYLPPWKFQYDIPTIWCEFSIHAPITGYVTQLHGQIKPTKYEEKYEGKYQYWLMTDIPAFKPENLMPDEQVYISSVEFGTRFNTWAAIHANLMLSKNFWGILEYHNFLNNKVEELIAGMKDSIQMINAISKYLKKEINFTGTNDFLADEPQETMEKKQGTAGDINLLFATMLKKAGFDVNLVLLSTRDHGFVLETFTSTSQFNYVICNVVVDKKELYLDATEKYLPFDMLPEQCLNHKGFLVSEKQYGWIGIEPTQRDKISVEAYLSLTASGSLKGEVSYSKHGYAAFRARKTFHESGEELYRKNAFSNKLWTIEKSEITNMTDLDKPVIESYNLTMNDYATVANETLYINPHIFIREEFNPFTSDQRIYPIDFGRLTDHLVISNITIPDGYEIEKMPENKALVLPGGAARCTFNFTKTKNKITVMTRLQINKTLFQPEEYPSLKEFYNRLIAKKAEIIVFKKIVK